jgi:phosphoribosylaminoimidazole-succinocarboxamide synthase
MLDEKEIIELVKTHGEKVNSGRSITKIIVNWDIPRLYDSFIVGGKVSDSVFGGNLFTKEGVPIRLMYRNNRISTHDVVRGNIPFKDQVLAQNHDFMLKLVKDVVGSSQFDVPGLNPSSTVIPSEDLTMFSLENVLRMFMAESSTSTSLYQNWLTAKEDGLSKFLYSDHKIVVDNLSPNSVLPYIMDTPSTKGEIDVTVNPNYLFENDICSPGQYAQIRNSSIMAFGIVSQHLKDRGMVLVDTKTEHGVNHLGEIVSADELYTMDSSRFWMLDEGGEVLVSGGKPVSFSKEFARGMVKSSDHMFNKDESDKIAVRYIQGFQNLTGKTFEPDLRSRDERIIDSTNLILDYLT